MVEIVDHRGRPLSAAASQDSKDKQESNPSATVGQVAGLDREIEWALKGWYGVIQNRDPLMTSQRPTNASYLAGFGLFEEMIDNDPHILGVVQQRKLACLAAPCAWLPADENNPEALRVQAFLDHVFATELDDLEDSRAEAWMAIFYGVSYLEADWQPRSFAVKGKDRTDTYTDAIIPVKLWSRRRGRFVFGKDLKPRLLTENNRTGGEELPERKILHHAPRKRYENPYGEPLARVIWRWHFMKKHCAKWRVIDIERYGSPFAVLKHKAGATAEELSQYDAILQALKQGCGVRIPEELLLDLANAFHSTSGASPHETWADFCDKQIAIAVLGQTLTSQQGDKGTQALGTVHMDVRDSLVQADATTLSAAMNRLAKWIVEINFGPRALPLAPKYSIDTKKRDVKAFLENVEKAQKIGLSVSEKQVREETGLKPPDDDKDELSAPTPAPSPFDPPAPGNGDDNDDDKDPADKQKAQVQLDFIPTSQAASEALGLPPVVKAARPASFTAAENKRARLAAELGDKLPGDELKDHYEDGVSACSKILSDIPLIVKQWLLSHYDDLEAPLVILPDPDAWAALEFPEDMKDSFVDRLNDDITIAQLLGRETVLYQADSVAEASRRPDVITASEADDSNPLVEKLWGKKRIIPRRVLSVMNRKVRHSVSWETFYRLDALARSAAFTAWDLMEADIRHMGAALQDAINWNYTVGQFADYLYTRLQARYVQQGEELHAWHVRTIYYTNHATAFNQAQADELHDLADTFGYVEFVNPDPQTPCCVERVGKVYATDGPFMRANTPPLHFGCGSTLRALTSWMVEDEGLEIESAMPSVPPEIYAGPKDAYGNPVGEPAPFGAWAPLDERYEHLEAELARVGST